MNTSITPAAQVIQELSINQFYERHHYLLTEHAWCVALVHDNTTIALKRIATTDHGVGYGSAALDIFVALCDQYGCDIILEADPFKVNNAQGKPLTKARLQKWYASRGFSTENTGYVGTGVIMKRLAQK